MKIQVLVSKRLGKIAYLVRNLNELGEEYVWEEFAKYAYIEQYRNYYELKKKLIVISILITISSKFFTQITMSLTYKFMSGNPFKFLFFKVSKRNVCSEDGSMVEILQFTNMASINDFKFKAYMDIRICYTA